MSIEAGFFQLLTSDVTLTSMLADPENVFFVQFPKDISYPAVRISGVSRSSINSFDGENRTQAKRYQFDSFAPNDATVAFRISQQIHDLLVPYSDSIQPSYPYQLPDGTSILSAEVHMDNDAEPEIGEEGELFRRILDIEFFYVPSS